MCTAILDLTSKCVPYFVDLTSKCVPYFRNLTCVPYCGKLGMCTLFQTWPQNVYPISDLTSKCVPYFRPFISPDLKLCTYFRPDLEMYTLFQTWPQNVYPISDLTSKCVPYFRPDLKLCTLIQTWPQNVYPISDLTLKYVPYCRAVIKARNIFRPDSCFHFAMQYTRRDISVKVVNHPRPKRHNRYHIKGRQGSLLYFLGVKITCFGTA